MTWWCAPGKEIGCLTTPISPQAHRLLQLTASTTFDNISVALSGTFSDPRVIGFGTNTYSINGDFVRVQFKVNDYGEIEIDSDNCDSGKSTPDGPLKGGAQAEYQITSTALSRTARVLFRGIGVVVDGDVVPLAASISFRAQGAWGAVSGGLSYTYALTGNSVEMLPWEANFQLKVVELP